MRKISARCSNHLAKTDIYLHLAPLIVPFLEAETPPAGALETSVSVLSFTGWRPLIVDLSQTLASTLGGILVACPQFWLNITLPAIVDMFASTKYSEGSLSISIHYVLSESCSLTRLDQLPPVVATERAGRALDRSKRPIFGIFRIVYCMLQPGDICFRVILISLTFRCRSGIRRLGLC